MTGGGNRKGYLRWGIILLVFLGFAAAVRWYLQGRRECSIRCVAVHRTFLRAMRTGDYNVAYRLMSREYRSANTLANFRQAFRAMGETPDYDWKVVHFGITGCRIGSESGFFTTGAKYEYVREDGQWRFTGRTDRSAD